MKLNKTKLVPLKKAKKLAKQFKQQAEKEPEQVAERKQWGDKIVNQVISGVNRFQKDGNFPSTP